MSEKPGLGMSEATKCTGPIQPGDRFRYNKREHNWVVREKTPTSETSYYWRMERENDGEEGGQTDAGLLDSGYFTRLDPVPAVGQVWCCTTSTGTFVRIIKMSVDSPWIITHVLFTDHDEIAFTPDDFRNGNLAFDSCAPVVEPLVLTVETTKAETRASFSLTGRASSSALTLHDTVTTPTISIGNGPTGIVGGTYKRITDLPAAPTLCTGEVMKGDRFRYVGSINTVLVAELPLGGQQWAMRVEGTEHKTSRPQTWLLDKSQFTRLDPEPAVGQVWWDKVKDVDITICGDVQTHGMVAFTYAGDFRMHKHDVSAFRNGRFVRRGSPAIISGERVTFHVEDHRHPPEVTKAPEPAFDEAAFDDQLAETEARELRRLHHRHGGETGQLTADLGARTFLLRR